MKIRLTEGQYKRLLSEDNKSFLDGQVDFKNIGNRVDKFIANCFEYVYKKNTNDNINFLTKTFMTEFSITEGESALLSHNYKKLNDGTGEFKKFIGEPLEFYGEFSWEGTLPVMSYINGTIDGKYTGYATSPEEFYEKMEEGDYDDVYDEGGNVDWDDNHIDWEIDYDWASESLGNQLEELDKDDVIDGINIE
jgi:hypothetical protein